MRLILLLSLFTVGCSDETISGYADRKAVYRLTEIGGEPFPAKATISFPEEGRAVGQGPCNAWSAEQSVPYPWIDLGPIVATRRACPDLEAEAKFFEELAGVSLAELSGEVLLLSGEVEMVFRAD